MGSRTRFLRDRLLVSVPSAGSLLISLFSFTFESPLSLVENMLHAVSEFQCYPETPVRIVCVSMPGMSRPGTVFAIRKPGGYEIGQGIEKDQGI